MGSTTYKEFRQHFEKDRALVRRFQKIDVNEPTIEDTIKILKGLKTYYEEFHKLRYTDDAIKAAVELSASTSPTASCRTRRSTSSTRRAPARCCCPRASGRRSSA